MDDLFKNYFLQREELLARIAQELQLDKTRLERMEKSYESISQLLKSDETFFYNLDIELYSQGSKRISTTVKPIKNDDFDLDTVLHIYDIYHHHSPQKIYNELLRVIESDSYYKSICEKKKRCVRLNYKSDFHLDILPACMQYHFDREKIAIPEKNLQTWSSGNPKGYANWFLQIANSVQKPMLRSFSESLLKAQVDTEPLPDELYIKTPLQRAVQLIKRYRDIYFQNKENEVSSIVITTLIARYYNGENTIYETINNTLLKVKDSYADSLYSSSKFKVLNPVDNNENFTDSWTKEHYSNFQSFINDLYSNWQKLKTSFETDNLEYIKLFGEGIYKQSLVNQIKTFSKFSSDDLIKATGLILTNNAYTDNRGKINANQGVKNGLHHNFGGIFYR